MVYGHPLDIPDHYSALVANILDIDTATVLGMSVGIGDVSMMEFRGLRILHDARMEFKQAEERAQQNRPMGIVSEF
jgi:hypothetical protein